MNKRTNNVYMIVGGVLLVIFVVYFGIFSYVFSLLTPFLLIVGFWLIIKGILNMFDKSPDAVPKPGVQKMTAMRAEVINAYNQKQVMNLLLRAKKLKEREKFADAIELLASSANDPKIPLNYQGRIDFLREASQLSIKIQDAGRAKLYEERALELETQLQENVEEV